MRAAAALCAAATVARGELPEQYPTTAMKGVQGSVPMPMIGVGTWLYNDSVAQSEVATALRVGYRHVDTAEGYGNQKGVGAALAASGLHRDEYFVTSKIPGGLNASATVAHADNCLAELGIQYVDLMLVHFPATWSGEGGAAGRQEEWTALEGWAKSGKARAIGVSHFCRKHVDDILAVATVPIALNQVQYHIGMGTQNSSYQHDKEYMLSKDIVYMGYSSLCGPCPAPGNKELITGDLVTSIGKAHNKTGPQVALRWVVQQGIPVIPKAQDVAFLEQDLDLFSWELTADEMDQLSNATSPPETGTPPQAPDDAQDCLVA